MLKCPCGLVYVKPTQRDVEIYISEHKTATPTQSIDYTIYWTLCMDCSIKVKVLENRKNNSHSTTFYLEMVISSTHCSTHSEHSGVPWRKWRSDFVTFPLSCHAWRMLFCSRCGIWTVGFIRFIIHWIRNPVQVIIQWPPRLTLYVPHLISLSTLALLTAGIRWSDHKRTAETRWCSRPSLCCVSSRALAAYIAYARRSNSSCAVIRSVSVPDL